MRRKFTTICLEHSYHTYDVYYEPDTLVLVLVTLCGQ